MVKFPIKIIDLNDYYWKSEWELWIKNGTTNFHYYTDENGMPFFIEKRGNPEWGYIDNKGIVWEVMFLQT